MEIIKNSAFHWPSSLGKTPQHYSSAVAFMKPQTVLSVQIYLQFVGNPIPGLTSHRSATPRHAKKLMME